MTDSEAEIPEKNMPSQQSGNLPETAGKDWEQLAGRLPKIIRFRELCRCGDEIWIEHDGQLYRLRRTKQGKLILTK